MTNSHFLNIGSGDSLKSLLQDTVKKEKQCLLFVNSKRSAEKEAEEAAKFLGIRSAELEELSKKILVVLGHPTTQCERLSICVKGGTAFHHSGLHKKQREIIEDAFRNGLIKVISCTPTLAAGVDLPAYRSIIRDMKRYGRNGMEYIPVLEYLQISGRAGRPSYDKEGESIIIANTETEKEILIEKFIKGKPEEILSKLAVEPVLRTYALSLVASHVVRNADEIKEFFAKTFWAHQYKDTKHLYKIIEKVLEILEKEKFISTTKESIEATPLGRTVSQLYIDPLTAVHFINCLTKTKEKITPIALLHATNTTPEARPLLTVTIKEYEELTEQSERIEEELIAEIPTMFDEEYEEHLKAVKTTMMLIDWISEVTEEEILEKYKSRPGETRTRIQTLDWLLYALGELARVQGKHKIVLETQKLRTRLEYGAREELLPLLELKGIGRIRARILYRNGIKNIGAVKRTSYETITQLIGPALAKSVKEQVESPVEKISERKRKGQLGLGKWEDDD
ncbi:hypothetical protein HY483_04100 [Candidatus Woesearchaeota archaeon]|nr:hypothetical protein [Candidatus Woesearchaeota archaeon]